MQKSFHGISVKLLNVKLAGGMSYNLVPVRSPFSTVISGVITLKIFPASHVEMQIMQKKYSLDKIRPISQKGIIISIEHKSFTKNC
jgi:hypothetical protein